MKRIVKTVSWLLLSLFWVGTSVHAQSYNKLWKQLEQAQQKDLPQTVIQLSEKIFQKGKREQNAPQMLKAYLCRGNYQRQIAPDSLYSELKELEQWTRTEKQPVNRAILYSLLAYEYKDYFQKNRATLLARTELGEETSSADIREWTSGQLISRIVKYIQASLSNWKALLKASSQEYVPFVELEEGSRFYGHDMYHLLAHRAVDVYKSLGSLETDSLVQNRVEELYTDMLAAYGNRSGKEEALLLTALDYWSWKQETNQAAFSLSGEEEQLSACNNAYLQVLDSLINLYGTHEVCAEVYIRKATLFSNNTFQRYAEAVQLCEEGIERYPSYARIGMLKNLRATLLQPSVSMNVPETVYPGDTLQVQARCRNLGGFTLSLYQTDFQEMPWRKSSFDKDFYKNHTRLVSALHYEGGSLVGERIYRHSDTTFVFHMPDKPGIYLLQAIPDAKDGQTDAVFLTVSRLKTLTLSLPDKRIEFLTIDARSGWLVEGVQLTFYTNNNPETRKQLAELVSDAGGRAVLNWNREMRYCRISKGEDTALPLRYLHHGGYRTSVDSSAREVVTLLTDRSLYRPGQTVHVKGIAYEQSCEHAAVLEGKDYEVQLLDANRKGLSRQKVRTNEMGSFTTDFVLPLACLNGTFTIRVEGYKSVPVRVEEYKRPSFSIAFQPLKTAYCLGDTVNLAGKVEAFNGIPVQKVPLAYTVVRDASLYRWHADNKPLLSDTIRLDAEGNFYIPVVLSPAKDSTLFQRFQITATVTGEAGETQTETYVLNASAKPYIFVPEINRELCKDDSLSATFTLQNCNGQVVEGEGTYRLYALNSFKEKGAAGNPVAEGTFVSGKKLLLDDWKLLPSDRYRLVLAAPWMGKEVDNLGVNEVDILLFSLSDKRPPAFMDIFLHPVHTEFDETQPAVFYFGTSHKEAYVWVDVFDAQRRLDSQALVVNDSIIRMEYPYKAEYGKGISVLFTFVKEGTLHTSRVELRKPVPERMLQMKWEVFRDRLRPGQEEEWKLTIKTPQGLPAAAEMLAAMYDASLDWIFKRHQSLAVYCSYYLPYLYRNGSEVNRKSLTPWYPAKTWKVPTWYFDHFYVPASNFVVTTLDGVSAVGYGNSLPTKLTGRISGITSKALAVLEDAASSVEMKSVHATIGEMESQTASKEGLDTSQTGLRTNFAETVFFYPQLHTNEQGEIAFSFTMPQSLACWNFAAWSHTKEMMTGNLEATVVTAKEFMLSPNMPRFVRVGDQTQIAATIANQTNKTVKGTVKLTLFDPVTEKIILAKKQRFAVAAGQNSVVTFNFEAFENSSLLGVRMVADGGTFSDGEQHLLPVLSDKEFITETLPMPMRGKETRTFSLDSLFNRRNATATNRRLLVEFTGNPAWYAVQALPVLSQQKTDNAVSWATAWYANVLAGYIANSQPRIKIAFDRWQTAGSTKEMFLSQLEKNQEVKNILLSESPWLLEAANESEQRSRIATLFDVNQQNNRTFPALSRLKDLQGEDGAWSWYKGMPGNRSMTSYIAGLFVRLPLLTGTSLSDEADDMKRKALNYLNQAASEEYRDLLRMERRGVAMNALSSEALEWLYLIALDGTEVDAAYKQAYEYFLEKAANETAISQMGRKARIAVVLLKNNRMERAEEFIASLKEHLVQEDEMGAHFAFYDTPYRWGMMPVPVHVSVMEALRMAGGNNALLEEMKLWLLKQKQTISWNSPVATADAVYALLCQGDDLLGNQGDVRLFLGQETVTTRGDDTGILPGLSYVKKAFTEGTALEARKVTVEKQDEGIAWGAIYAQYLSPISDLAQQGGAFNVKKTLYVERFSANGSKSLQPLTQAGTLAVGDKLVSRLVIRLDRAMDYVHLKDQRSACFEPVGNLSGYCRNNGMGYYVEIEDASTNFFFSHLGKGTYVLEHSYRVVRSGIYESGLACMQCIYAPEYASYAAGGMVTVK